MAMKSYMSDKLRAKMSFTCAWSKEWRVSNFGGMKINKTIKRDTGRETQEVKKKHVNRIKGVRVERGTVEESCPVVHSS